MIEIRIPKEITMYKEKLFFNLTLRQTICSAVAMAINIPLYFFGSKYIGEEMASWTVIVLAVPIMLTGFFKYNGMSFEKFAVVFIINNFLYPQKRKYKTENLFEILDKYEKEEKKNAKKSTRNKEQQKESSKGKEESSKDSTTGNSI